MMIQITFTTAIDNQFNVQFLTHTVLVLSFSIKCDVINKPVSVESQNHIQSLRYNSDLSDLLISCCCRLLIFFFALRRANWTSSALLDAINTPPHRKHTTHTMATSNLSRSHKWRRAVIGWQPETLNYQQVKYWWAHSTRWLRWVRVLILSVKDWIKMFNVYCIIISIEYCEYLFVNLMFQTCNDRSILN